MLQGGLTYPEKGQFWEGLRTCPWDFQRQQFDPSIPRERCDAVLRWEGRLIPFEFSVENAEVQWACIRLADVNAQSVTEPIKPFARAHRGLVVMARNRDQWRETINRGRPCKAMCSGGGDIGPAFDSSASTACDATSRGTKSPVRALQARPPQALALSNATSSGQDPRKAPSTLALPETEPAARDLVCGDTARGSPKRTSFPTRQSLATASEVLSSAVV